MTKIKAPPPPTKVHVSPPDGGVWRSGSWFSSLSPLRDPADALDLYGFLITPRPLPSTLETGILRSLGWSVGARARERLKMKFGFLVRSGRLNCRGCGGDVALTLGTVLGWTWRLDAIIETNRTHKWEGTKNR